MDTKNPTVPNRWECALAGIAAGVVPVCGMLAIQWFADQTSGLSWPAHTPEPAGYLLGWSIAGLCVAVSVALQWQVFRSWPLPEWLARVAQWLLIPAWAACLAGMPGLAFGLLCILAVTAAVTVRIPLRGGAKGWRAKAAALLACPLLAWCLYLSSVLYAALMMTP